MGLVAEQTLHRAANPREAGIDMEMRFEKSGEHGQGGAEEEHPRNGDGDVSEPYIIIVMGQL